MDKDRIIKIEELEVGDEILVACSSDIRYYKVLRKPKKTSKPLAYPSRGMAAGTLVDRWSGVKCSMKLIEEEKPRWPGSNRVKTFTTYFCTPEEHNCEKMVYGLDYRDMWLVKREI